MPANIILITLFIVDVCPSCKGQGRKEPTCRSCRQEARGCPAKLLRARLKVNACAIVLRSVVCDYLDCNQPFVCNFFFFRLNPRASDYSTKDPTVLSIEKYQSCWMDQMFLIVSEIRFQLGRALPQKRIAYSFSHVPLHYGTRAYVHHIAHTNAHGPYQPHPFVCRTVHLYYLHESSRLI